MSHVHRSPVTPRRDQYTKRSIKLPNRSIDERTLSSSASVRSTPTQVHVGGGDCGCLWLVPVRRSSSIEAVNTSCTPVMASVTNGWFTRSRQWMTSASRALFSSVWMRVVKKKRKLLCSITMEKCTCVGIDQMKHIEVRTVFCFWKGAANAISQYHR